MQHSFSPHLVLPFFLIIICSSLVSVKSFQSLFELPQFLQPFENWVSSNKVSVNDHGAKGDGVTDDTKAFIDAWELACSFHSRTTLEIPEGKVYLIGQIDFGGPCRSKLTLSVSGTIAAPEDPHFWDGLNPRKWLYFHGVDHLVIKGNGTINGMGMKWWEQSCKCNPDNPCRHAPTAITFHRCNNLKVHDLTILNSQQIHMAFTNCYDVKASGLKVMAPQNSPNTDGIHISSSKHVQVIDSEIATGDDCISIVGNTSFVRIKDITCGPGHGVSIGSLGKYNSCSQVYDVMVDGAKIFNTENGVRIKTWQTLSVKVDRVSFIGIVGTSATEEAIRFACSDSFPCESIRLANIQLSYPDGDTTSYCWNAFGSSSGLVYPSPCFSYGEHIIEQSILSRTTLHSIT
eukprot:TRINITY_DN1377_c0_g1_i1.p1 TRINITY_DN1377_c0_g1~~TRINITY_DN1377_c0_g1_i1.p1  ORF type:complete len:402 (+),score=62.59 TRINITY_DN1377_c0_g1_i1:128-1333(+)